MEGGYTLEFGFLLLLSGPRCGLGVVSPWRVKTKAGRQVYIDCLTGVEERMMRGRRGGNIIAYPLLSLSPLYCVSANL